MTRSTEPCCLGQNLAAEGAELVMTYPEGVTIAALMDFEGVDHAVGRRLFQALFKHPDWDLLPAEDDRGRASRLWPCALLKSGSMPRPSLSAAEAAVLVGLLDFFDGEPEPHLVRADPDVLSMMAARPLMGSSWNYLDGLCTAGALVPVDGPHPEFLAIRRGFHTINPTTLAAARALRGEGELEPLKLRGLIGTGLGAGTFNLPSFQTLAEHAASVWRPLIKKLPEGVTARGLAFLYGVGVDRGRVAVQALVDDHGWRERIGGGTERRVWPVNVPAPQPIVPIAHIALLDWLNDQADDRTHEFALGCDAAARACGALCIEQSRMDYGLSRLKTAQAIDRFDMTAGPVIRVLRPVSTINVDRRARAAILPSGAAL